MSKNTKANNTCRDYAYLNSNHWAQVVYFGGEELTLLPLEQVASRTPREILLWLDRDKCSEGYGAFFLGRSVGSEDGRVSNGGYAVHLGNPTWISQRPLLQHPLSGQSLGIWSPIAYIRGQWLEQRRRKCPLGLPLLMQAKRFWPVEVARLDGE